MGLVHVVVLPIGDWYIKGQELVHDHFSPHNIGKVDPARVGMDSSGPVDTEADSEGCPLYLLFQETTYISKPETCPRSPPAVCDPV